MEGPLHSKDHGASERVLPDGFGAIVSESLLRLVDRTRSHNVSRVSFFDEAPRIGHKDYIPTESDVLRARTKTTGIYETRFSMGQLSIQLVDADAGRVLRCVVLTCNLLACSMWADSGVNGKSGSTASKQ